MGLGYTSLWRKVGVPVSEVGEHSAGPSLLLIFSKLQMILSFEHLVDCPGVSTVQLLPVDWCR